MQAQPFNSPGFSQQLNSCCTSKYIYIYIYIYLYLYVAMAVVAATNIGTPTLSFATNQTKPNQLTNYN
ncbi:hypothetical protein K6L59_03555, partial [Candidatus Phytoplasma sp. Tabriz.2]|nr:hypothetical protein [Candidatus Phytoplasma australiense]MCX2957164.1 hypothetical protein [Candidatus Regiella insecticola]